MRGMKVSQNLPVLVLLLWNCVLVRMGVTSASLRDAFTEGEIRKIEQFSGDVMSCANIPGMSLGIVRGDATFATGLGVADMTTGHPMDKRTILSLGSTAKAFVPYVLAEIMNGKENRDGRIKWNSTLKEILQHNRNLRVPHPWSAMTLEDMLIYRSGGSAADLSTMAGLSPHVTREELIRRLQFLPDTAEFRKSNHYSNIMYTVAGHLAERMSGMSWEHLFKALVMDKQNMSASTFAPAGMTQENSGLPYRFHHDKLDEPFTEQNISLFDLRPFEPVGSLMVSAEDITKWMRHILHNLHVKGNDSGVNLLIGDSFHQWVAVPEDDRDGFLSHDSEIALGYGMGWYSTEYRGFRRYAFTGHHYAYSSYIWLLPDARLAVYLSGNGPGTEHAERAMEGIMYHLTDTALRHSVWVDPDTACCCSDTDYDYQGDLYVDHAEENQDDVEQRIVNYLAPVGHYTGVYGHGFLGNVKVEANSAGILHMKLGQNLEGELLPSTSEPKMKFQAYGWLLNTEEWSTEKVVEFFLSDTEVTTDEFHILRIHVSDQLFYDFEKGKLFETMLAEEEPNNNEPVTNQDTTIADKEVTPPMTSSVSDRENPTDVQTSDGHDSVHTELTASPDHPQNESHRPELTTTNIEMELGQGHSVQDQNEQGYKVNDQGEGHTDSGHPVKPLDQSRRATDGGKAGTGTDTSNDSGNRGSSSHASVVLPVFLVSLFLLMHFLGR